MICDIDPNRQYEFSHMEMRRDETHFAVFRFHFTCPQQTCGWIEMPVFEFMKLTVNAEMESRRVVENFKSLLGRDGGV